jgi:anti-sigma factor RsiW
MTCLRENNQGSDLLIGYLEGTLPEVDRRELDSHAAECAECRGLLAVQATLEEYAPLATLAPEVSAGFDAKLYARIAADEARRPWWDLSWGLSWRVLAPAVGVMAMLAVAVFVQRPVLQTTVDPVVSQDVQQLEQALEDLELLSAPESL